MEGVHKGVAACRWHASSDRPSRQARRRESPPLELNYSTSSPSHAGKLSHLGAARAWEGAGGGYRCPCPTAVTDAKGRHALWAASPERLSVFLSGTPSHTLQAFCKKLDQKLLIPLYRTRLGKPSQNPGAPFAEGFSCPARARAPELAEGFSWPVRPRTGRAAVLNLLRVYGKMSLIKEFSRDPAGGTPAPAHVRQEEPPCVIMLTDL